jgi:2-oxoglutarate/2-oxoacid ferredoxin oxidoreductase subunit beta
MVTAKDYRTDADVVWCAGCGDFGVMAALSKAFAQLAIPNEDIVLISGIGCSSRLPGYFDVFGFNTLHGRALPVAQGVKIARPELTVVVATGDGDALAIGAGHFLHAARRNTDMTVLLFDNQVYGLTKGQASPTTPMGDKMQLASYGVQEEPIRPLSLAIHCGASFAGRGFSGDPKGLQRLIVQAIQHRGFSLVQVMSPCVTFRAKWDPFQTIRDRLSLIPDDHDPSDRVAAIALLDDDERIYMGVAYRRERPTYGDLMDRVAELAKPEQAPPIEQVLNDFVD